MDKKIKILEKQIKTSNPSFTMASFRRTIELVIIEAEGLFFMDTLSADRIKEVILSIPTKWKIEERIRDYKGELC
jgi:hypothetical protein